MNTAGWKVWLLVLSYSNPAAAPVVHSDRPMTREMCEAAGEALLKTRIPGEANMGGRAVKFVCAVDSSRAHKIWSDQN